MLRVHSIFESIDGEVNQFHQGRRTIFLRLAGCNLCCKYCFGVKPGRRIPRIQLAKQPNKKINEVQVGDVLMTFDEEMQLVETEVTKIMHREVDKWIEIKIHGKIYFVTPEHPFFTTRGLIRAEYLETGDMILHSSPQDKISFSKLGDKNPMKNREVVQRSVNNTDYKKMGRRLSETIKKKKEQGMYRSSWSILSEERKEQVRALFSKTKLGQLNPNWKGGSTTPNYDLLKTMCIEKELTECKNCKEEAKLECHHLDGEQENDSWDNLTTICHSCHSKIHQRGYNFWMGKRADGKKLSVKRDVILTHLNGFEVQSIKNVDISTKPQNNRPSPLKVYNFSCSPYDTYLVDYMWVHNCDTVRAQDPSSGQDMKVQEVAKILTDTKLSKITITGGEPLLQMDEIKELIYQVRRIRWMDVTIETNGSIPLPPSWSFHIVMDYKTASSGENDKMAPENFQFLREDDIVKFVIGNRLDYEQALKFCEVLNMRLGVAPHLAFSPMHGKLDPAVLIEWMKQEGPPHAIINLQLHKYIYPNAGETEV